MTIPLLLAALAAVSPAQAAPADESSLVAVMCDPVTFRFSIRADASAASLDPGYPIAKLLRVDDLFFAGGLPGWTNEADVLGPLIHYERCGPYTFKFEGDAYNFNVQGESGAYPPFATVSILRHDHVFDLTDGKTLRLTSCDRTLPRAAPCPKGYAVRLDGAYDAVFKVLRLVLTTSSHDGDVEDSAVVTRVVRIDAHEDLGMWNPE